MSGYTADTQVGRVVAGEQDTIWVPRTPRAGKRGVILLHGQSAPRGFMEAPSGDASVRLAAGIANAGIPCVAAEMHGNSWINDTAVADVTRSWDVLRAAFPDMRADKVLLLGISMGGAFAARYSQLHPDKVGAVVGIIPAYDPKAGYIANNIGDFYMEQAWGFSGLANFPDALDLASHSGDAAGVPILTGYASNDTYVPPQSSIDYHEAVGGLPGNLVNLGALDHTNAAIAAMPISAVARFLVANGA